MDRMVFCVLIVRAGGGVGLLFLQERNCGGNCALPQFTVQVVELWCCAENNARKSCYQAALMCYLVFCQENSKLNLFER